MEEKVKQLVPRKHIAKKMTNEQEKIVEIIQTSQNMRTMAEAKHEYFENQEKYDEMTKNAEEVTQEYKTKNCELAKQIKATPEPAAIEIPKREPPKAEYNVIEKKKEPMTIAETKLGVTMVINKEECEKIGIPGTSTTRDAIKELKKRLGL